MSRRKAVQIVWAAIVIVAALIFYRVNTDPAVHHGANIELRFDPLSSMLVESDHPVSLQASGGRPFALVNMDDGTVVQGIVVSTPDQNLDGEVTFQTGPEVISAGHWYPVESHDSDSSLRVLLKGDADLGVTIYPDNNAAGLAVVMFGFIIWLLGVVVLLKIGVSKKREDAEIPTKTRATPTPVR